MCQNKKLTTSTGRSRPSGSTSFSATSLLHYSFYPSNLCGLCCPATCRSPMARWQSVIPSLTATTQSPDTDTFFFQCGTTTQSRTSTTPSHTFTTNEQDRFFIEPLGAALRLKTTQKKQVSTTHKQLFDSLTDTPVERSVLLSQSTSHTGAHLMQPSSAAVKRTRLRIAASAFR